MTNFIMSETAYGLYLAGLNYPGAKVCLSGMHPVLMEMATRHAQYQADHKRQGHQLWSKRVKELETTMGSYRYAEIAAESWGWQKDASKVELGAEMFKCWEQSPGHWSVASKSHTYFGCDMAQSSKGIWYTCIIVADSLDKQDFVEYT